MFERLIKAFAPSAQPSDKSGADSRGGSDQPGGKVSQWAAGRGLKYAANGEGEGFALTGKVAGRSMKLERGRSSRDYIRGEELRVRAELSINEEVAVLIMNRPLKEALEKRAYQMFTDTLQTTADPNLPEEMRWLSLYQEVGWDIPNPAFWKRYSVLADEREHARAWVNADLAVRLMAWPKPGPDEQVPFILMLLRGKGYLRMQYTPADLPTLDHAAGIFNAACQSAVDGLSTDIAL